MAYKLGYYTAIRTGNLQEVRQLFEADDLAYSDENDGTLLHYAAHWGTLEIVQFFVESGADVNSRGGILEASPITYAAGSGKLDIVRYLFEAGAIVDTRHSVLNPLLSA